MQYLSIYQVIILVLLVLISYYMYKLIDGGYIILNINVLQNNR